jgi:hypothetical protein
VTSVNDPPVGTDKTVSTPQNTAYTFTTADFGFTDPNDVPANTLLAVKITTLPGAGTLTDNGVAVTTGQFIPVADIAGGKLKFTPVLGAFGSPYVSFTFQVQDNGGTANGGVDLDLVPKAIRINVAQLFNPAQVLVVGADAGTTSKPTVTVFNAVTGSVIVKFTAYEPTYTGGVRVALGDVTGDGIPEIITIPGRSHAPLVKVFDIQTGAELTQYAFMADSASFINGMSVAVGDVNGDGRNDIVTVPSSGTAQVKVFENHIQSGGGFVQTRSFNAFGDFPSFTGGATVAVADLDGSTDGNTRADIIVASGSGMAGLIRLFDVTANRSAYTPIRQIADPNPKLRGGLSVTVGDVNGDGYLDIITGAGQSGSSLVRVYNGNPAAGKVPMYSFQAFTDASNTSAIRVAAKDVDGTGKFQVYVAQGTNSGSHYQVRRFRPLTGQLVDAVFADDPGFAGGGLNIG